MLTQQWTPFIIMTLIAFVLGVLIIIPIGARTCQWWCPC